MEKVTLKVQYGNFSVEVSGPENYAEKKLDELLKKYGNVQKAHEPTSPAEKKLVTASSKKISPAEYIKKESPKSQADRALLLWYYLEKLESRENFSTNELTEINKIAKQSRFTNISDTVAKLVKQGLMMGSGETDGKRAFTLTTSGEEAVEALSSKAKK